MRFYELEDFGGIASEVRSRIVGANAHVMIMRHDRDPITDYQPLVDKILTHPEVKGASPFIYGKALVSCGSEAEGGVLRGVMDPQERAVTDIMKYVISVTGPFAELHCGAASRTDRIKPSASVLRPSMTPSGRTTTVLTAPIRAAVSS